MYMQLVDHNLRIKSVLIPDIEDECRIMESDISGETGAPNIDFPIGYWMLVHELFNSYNSPIPDFQMADVSKGLNAHEPDNIDEVI
jgi:hypothetical protein